MYTLTSKLKEYIKNKKEKNTVEGKYDIQW